MNGSITQKDSRHFTYSIKKCKLKPQDNIIQLSGYQI